MTPSFLLVNLMRNPIFVEDNLRQKGWILYNYYTQMVPSFANIWMSSLSNEKSEIWVYMSHPTSLPRAKSLTMQISIIS
ncbi:hypothetical protein C2S52_017579 [Perilla frutescens var. hirtella]|nr:hypothetical protein C2S52_017579 [Perilla frutescens var. hirtella]